MVLIGHGNLRINGEIKSLYAGFQIIGDFIMNFRNMCLQYMSRGMLFQVCLTIHHGSGIILGCRTTDAKIVVALNQEDIYRMTYIGSATTAVLTILLNETVLFKETELTKVNALEVRQWCQYNYSSSLVS